MLTTAVAILVATGQLYRIYHTVAKETLLNRTGQAEEMIRKG